jgi:hypothetical protein
MLHTIAPFAHRLRPDTRAMAADYQNAVTGRDLSAAAGLLERLADLGDIGALPTLLTYSPHGSCYFLPSLPAQPELIAAWNATVCRLFDALPLHAYLWLHNQRQHFTLSQGAAPLQLKVLETFSRNGRVREAALRSIPDDSPQSIAAQIVRLTDWVEPIRRFAALNLDALLDIEAIPTEWLAKCAPLILEVQAHRHADPALMTRLIDAFADDSAALKSAVVGSDRRIARASSIIAAGLDPDRRREVVWAGLAPTDPIVRRHWAEIGLRDTEPEVRALVHTLIADDRNPAIRILWLDTLLRDQPDQALVSLKRDLLSRSGGLRQYCQYHLRQLGVDVPAIYRSVLDAPISRDTAAALKGLGECGAAADIDYGLFYCDAESASIRQAALLLIGQRDPANQRQLFWAALDDPAPKVVRTAASMLRKQSLIYAEWQAKYAQAAPGTRRALLSLARRLHWPERGEAYRTLLGDPDLRAEVMECIGADPIARHYGDHAE